MARCLKSKSYSHRTPTQYLRQGGLSGAVTTDGIAGSQGRLAGGGLAHGSLRRKKKDTMSGAPGTPMWRQTLLKWNSDIIETHM